MGWTGWDWDAFWRSERRFNADLRHTLGTDQASEDPFLRTLELVPGAGRLRVSKVGAEVGFWSKAGTIGSRLLSGGKTLVTPKQGKLVVAAPGRRGIFGKLAVGGTVVAAAPWAGRQLRDGLESAGDGVGEFFGGILERTGEGAGEGLKGIGYPVLVVAGTAAAGLVVVKVLTSRGARSRS